MKKGLIVVIAIVAIIAIIGGVCVSNYNTLVTARETVDSAEANIDTYLQRRADLIPNIVASVKSFAKHETEVYGKIADARQKLVNAGTVAEKAEANSELTSALQGLNIVVENYPELKADANFVALQDQLEGTENRISVARKDYNDIATDYNTSIKKFPTVIFAGMFGFEKVDLFEATDESQTVPTVDFE